MTIDSKRFTRPLILAAAFAAISRSCPPGRIMALCSASVPPWRMVGRATAMADSEGPAGTAPAWANTTSAKARRGTVGSIPSCGERRAPRH